MSDGAGTWVGDGVGFPVRVSPGWLAANLGDVVVADARWYLDGRSGSAAYEAGHIEGAIFVDLDRCLSGPPSPEAGRHPLPEPAQFAEAMSLLGIGDGDTVVAYDDVGGIYAARLVWMLRVTGHAAAILDGGLAAWAGQMDQAVLSRPRHCSASSPGPPTGSPPLRKWPRAVDAHRRSQRRKVSGRRRGSASIGSQVTFLAQ